jgi:hypothetical protein
MKFSHVAKYISYLPLVLLIGIALSHIRLSYTADASPWHGGSFGMFAVIDGLATRKLEVLANVGGKEIPIDLSSHHEELQRTVLLPTDAALAQFANMIACDKELVPTKATSLSLRYYKAAFDARDFSVTSKLQKDIAMVRCGN